MKGTYKPSHNSQDNMNTHSTTNKLDFMDEQLKKIKDDMFGFN
jgi:hypothetical protein